MVSFTFAENLIEKTFIVVTQHLLIESESVFWVELYLKGWFELIDYFCEVRWEIISEIVFRSRWVSVIALL